jgi:hypothetical protein
MKTLLTVLSFLAFEQILSQTKPSYPDNSPGLEDFLNMGFPDCNRSWDSEDYQSAVEILDQIYEADKYSLPRADSEFSGIVFRRMLSFENFNFLSNPTINLGKRIIEFETVKLIPSRLTLYYEEDYEKFERFGAELLDCFLLETFVLSQGLIAYEELRNQLGQKANEGRFKMAYDQLNLQYINCLERIFKIFETEYYRYDEQVLSTFGTKFFFYVKSIENVEIKKQLKERIKLIDRTQLTASLQEILIDLKQIL